MAAAAIIAVFHDILVVVGIYSIFQFLVTPDTVVAVLTVLGYSLYDTVVVFDRIRDNSQGLGASGRITYSEMVNLSMNQTLARSINTSLVAIIPVLSVLVIGSLILGATTLQSFGLALVIGLTSGAYSSIFIASPLLALMKEREPRYVTIRQRLEARGDRGPALTPAMAAAMATSGGPARARPRPARPAASSGPAPGRPRRRRPRSPPPTWWPRPRAAPARRRARPRARPDRPGTVRPLAPARARARARSAEAPHGLRAGTRGRLQRRSVGVSRYPVGMALATPVPAEGSTEAVDDSLAGSALPAAEAELLAPVLASFLRRHPGDDTSLIVRAAETATVAHAGQLRRSGEPYVTHPDRRRRASSPTWASTPRRWPPHCCTTPSRTPGSPPRSSTATSARPWP